MNDVRLKREHLMVRLLRALSGMSQRRLGEATGILPARIDQWERGKVLPGEEELQLLAEHGAGITLADAHELRQLYETQRRAFRRNREGIGAILDSLMDGILRRCIAAVRHLLGLAPFDSPPSAGDRREAEKRFAALKGLDGPSRLAVVRLNPDFQTWALCERCCEESVQEASRSLQRAAAWARLALAIARRVRGPKGWRNAILGYALAHWANILRVRGALEAADACFERARASWNAGSDPAGLLDPGRLLDLEGSLRRDQRRFADRPAALPGSGRARSGHVRARPPSPHLPVPRPARPRAAVRVMSTADIGKLAAAS